MFTGLEQKLNKANNIFVKAKKQYEDIIEAADDEVVSSNTIIETAQKTIETSEQIKHKAINALVGIKQIIGE